jgi:hypothetical protein
MTAEAYELLGNTETLLMRGIFQSSAQRRGKGPLRVLDPPDLNTLMPKLFGEVEDRQECYEVMKRKLVDHPEWTQRHQRLTLLRASSPFTLLIEH